ncbi:flocculation protein FLO11-like [Lactuca sativa]|uniref:flocculation protein FLO11-like n=1 Tax=Lactuca sativa TaxID=4236 RepID=UPI000CD848C7|nr:flocculation protein FLO11-like [Lactuca sativa]
MENPAKRGKRAVTKKVETKGPSTKTVKSKKQKAEKSASSAPKKVKKMEQSADEEEVVQHKGSPRGSTPPRSPTPTEQLNNKVATPPPSPLKTTVQVSVAIPIPPTQPTQHTTTVPPPPPVSTIPICTAPLPPPIISQSIIITSPLITTTNESIVKVNVSDTGANSEIKTHVTPKPLSPSPSSDSAPTLGGDSFDFDSAYFSPYRLPTDEDEEAQVTRQQVQSLDEKLDRFLASSSKYNDVVMKAFLDIVFEQYTGAIDKSTKAVKASTSSCKKATTDVMELVHTSHLFL